MNIPIEVLLFLPSVTFGLVPAEIFPWAFIYTFIKSNYIKIADLLIFVAFSIYCIACIIVSEHFIFLKAITSLVSFLNSIGTLFYIAKYATEQDIYKIYWVMRKLFYLLAILTIIQYVSVLEFLNEYWKFVVPRGSLSKLEGSRGVMGFSTEPSRFSYEIICFVVVLYVIRVKHRLMTIFLGTIAIIFASSLTGIFLLGLFILIAMPAFFIFLMGIVLTIYSLFDLSLPERLHFVTFLLNFDFQIFFEELLLQSFHRIPVLISSIEAVFSNPIGYGLGNWDLPQLLNNVEYSFLGGVRGSDFVNRPTFLFSLVVEFGLIPTFIVIYWLFLYIKITPYSIFLLFICLFVSDPGNPVPFLALGVLTYHQRRAKLEN